MSFIVAIDGPAGSGKGTITKIVSEKLNLINIDTGAMYRCVTLECLNKNVKSTDLEYTVDEMTGEFAESCYTDSIATLTDMEDDSVLQEHSVFKILYEITYIHTNERI